MNYFIIIEFLGTFPNRLVLSLLNTFSEKNLSKEKFNNETGCVFFALLSDSGNCGNLCYIKLELKDYSDYHTLKTKTTKFCLLHRIAADRLIRLPNRRSVPSLIKGQLKPRIVLIRSRAVTFSSPFICPSARENADWIHGETMLIIFPEV